MGGADLSWFALNAFSGVKPNWVVLRWVGLSGVEFD